MSVVFAVFVPAFVLSLVLATPVPAQELMPAAAGAWSAFAPRPQTAPVVDASTTETGYALHVDGGGAAGVYGGWTTRITGLTGRAFYRFRARALPVGIDSLREGVTIVL